nr:Ground region and Peptidase C46 domain containing protein [Haemonchus contortus]
MSFYHFQYDLNNVARENELASVDSRDPLGWKQAPLAVPEDFQDIGIIDSEAGSPASKKVLPGDDFNLKTPIVSVAGSTDGKTGTFRRQATEDSAATCAGRGPNADASTPLTFSANECCDSRLAQIMRSAADDSSSFAHLGDAAKFIQKRVQNRFGLSFEVIVSPGDFALASYGVSDDTCKYHERGFVAMAYATPIQAIQYDAEEELQMSFEVLVSTDDFAYASAYTGPMICKFRVDRYYAMAYASPRQYPIHTDFFDDDGLAIPLYCPAEVSVLSGYLCCDGTLQYEMLRSFYDERKNQSGRDIDAEALAKRALNNVQRRFNTTFESIVSPSDFVWRTHVYNQFSCKFVYDGLHALLFESSKPPAVPAAPPAIGPPQAPFGPPQAPFGPPQAPLGPPQAPFGPPQAPFAPPQAPFGPPQAPVAPPNAPFVAPPAPLASPGVFPVAPPAPVAPPPAAVEPAGFFPGGLEGGFGGGGFGGGGGGGGGGCFSTDTWVTTPDGKKRMDQLKVGDFILTANQTAAYFTPVTLWIHREPEVVTKFVTIMTDYGKMLALTPRHLIFRNKCDEFYSDRVTELPPNSKAVYAEELVVGDCVFLLYRNGFRQQKLQDISITSRKGVFSPLTPNGRILVNDMLASCYSDVMTSLRKRLLSLFGYWIDQSVDLPFGSEFSMELLRLIVPYIK